MITASISMGDEYSTTVHGKTILEVIEKIKDYHTMTNFEKELFTKKNKLQKEINTGWYIIDDGTRLGEK